MIQVGVKAGDGGLNDGAGDYPDNDEDELKKLVQNICTVIEGETTVY